MLSSEMCFYFPLVYSAYANLRSSLPSHPVSGKNREEIIDVPVLDTSESFFCCTCKQCSQVAQ